MIFHSSGSHLPASLHGSHVWSHKKSFSICHGQSDTVVDFLWVLRFPCQFSLRQLLHTHLSSEACTTGLLEATVPSRHSLTPSHSV
jgi:hypothetical protein